MKVVVPATGPLGDRLWIWTISDPDDPRTTISWTICIFDSNDRLVLMDVLRHTVSTNEDIKVHVEDITNLNSGIYKVKVYYGDYLNNLCENMPEDQLKYVFFIHKMGSDIVSLRMDASWYPERNYIFTMYVLNGILFYQSTSVRGVAIPANVDVFVEITGSDNNAYVGVVNARSDIIVQPNITIPFMAKLTFTLDKPAARDVAKAYANVVGFARGVVINAVDDYTFQVVIVKSEAGLYALAGSFLGRAITAIIFGIATWGIVKIIGFVVDIFRVNVLNNIFNERKKEAENYKAEYDRCGNDENCKRNVENKYLPIIQGYDSIIGALSSYKVGQCNGLNLGGVCVPWWVVAVGVFLAGLLVIAAVK